MKNACSSLICAMTLVSVMALLLGAYPLHAQDAPQASSVPVYVGGITTAPKLLHHVGPEYADGPRRKKIQGTVMLSITITPEGTVRDPEVTTSLDKDLDKQAIKAVSKWKFAPATKDGKPVAVHLAVVVDFHLH